MSARNRIVTLWLAVVCLAVFLMVVVGGVTRLTESGLSMVEWKPLIGFIPPLNESEWQDTFDAYKQYPQYQKVNTGMTLTEFKSIFYWEYGHRVLGRSVGLIFFLPFIVLLLLKKIDKPLLPKLLFALLLGGLQGLMGWYMVVSGLVDLPRVSHFRLAAHLLLALAILSYLFWLILGLIEPVRSAVTPMYRKFSVLSCALIVVQILYGAFTAGLRAGYGFNTFPLMDGQVLAPAATMMSPLWVNFVENGAMVQFIHRWLGSTVLLLVAGLFVVTMKMNFAAQLKKASALLLGITLLQFSLGVLTLLHYVPLMLASLHQAVACLVLLSSVLLVYLTRPAR